MFWFLFRFFGLAFRFPGTVISFSAKTTSALPRSPRAHHSTSIAPFPATKTTSAFPRSPRVPRAHLASIEIFGTGVSPCHTTKTTSALPHHPRAHHSTSIAPFPATKTTSALPHRPRAPLSAAASSFRVDFVTNNECYRVYAMARQRLICASLKWYFWISHCAIRVFSV